jgi:hypothetical protein
MPIKQDLTTIQPKPDIASLCILPHLHCPHKSLRTEIPCPGSGCGTCVIKNYVKSSEHIRQDLKI